MVRWLRDHHVDLSPAQFHDALSRAVDAFIESHNGAELSLRLTVDAARREYIGHALRLCDLDDAWLTRALVRVYSAARRRTLSLFPDAAHVLQSLRGR
jgi:hypothetical protein